MGLVLTPNLCMPVPGQSVSKLKGWVVEKALLDTAQLSSLIWESNSLTSVQYRDYLGIIDTCNIWSLSFIHSFTPQRFIKHLLCARHCARCWRYSSEQERHLPCPHGAYSLAGKTDIKQVITQKLFRWFLFWTRSHYIAQPSLKPAIILLPQLPKCWETISVPSCPAQETADKWRLLVLPTTSFQHPDHNLFCSLKVFQEPALGVQPSCKT